MKTFKNKIVVVGAGMVGSAVINELLTLDMIAEIAVIDANSNKARGESLDASHTTSYDYSPNVNVHEGDYEDCADSQIIIITAGPSAKPGSNTSRLELAKTNVSVVNDVMANIIKYTKDAIIIIVTNPVDVITYMAQQHFDYPKEKIIGTGTMLDTARFRRILAKKYLVDTKNVQGYILGEHGASALATWSLVNIAGIPVSQLDQFFSDEPPLDRQAIMQEVLSVGTEILNLKGYTNYGIASSVGRLIKAILLNELSVLPVSTTLNGEYGIQDVALSIPCILSMDGILRTLPVPLSGSEVENLKNSAQVLADNLDSLELRNKS